MISLAINTLSFHEWRLKQALIPIALIFTIASCDQSSLLNMTASPMIQPSSFTKEGIDLRRILIEDYGGMLERDNVQAYVQRVGKRLLDAVGYGAAPFRFMVLDSPIAQAIALPSRDLFVTRGMLTITTSESELAAVMALSMSLVHDGIAYNHLADPFEQSLTTQVRKQFDPGSPLSELMVFLDARYREPYHPDNVERGFILGLAVMERAGFRTQGLDQFMSRLIEDASRVAAHYGGKIPDPRHFVVTYPIEPARLGLLVEAFAGGRVYRDPKADRDMLLGETQNLAIDQNPERGYVVNNRFIVPRTGLSLTLPPGFYARDQGGVIVGHGPEGAAFAVDISTIDHLPPTARLERAHIHLRDVLGRPFAERNLIRDLETFKLGDYDAATFTSRLSINRGSVDFRLMAVRFANDQMARLVVMTPGRITAKLANHIREMAFSLQRVEDSSPPLSVTISYLKLRRAFGGEIAEQLADNLTDNEDNARHFLTVNGFKPGYRLARNEVYRVITP